MAIKLLIGGSPCFVAGTMVRTENGIKPIENITIGEKVLTHNCRYKTVTQVMSRVVSSTMLVSAENCVEKIECTAEHPFYVRQMQRKFEQRNREYTRHLSAEFYWLSPNKFVKKLNNSGGIAEQTYLTCATDNIEEEIKYNGVELAVNQFTTKHTNTLDLNDSNLWYVIGRWVADGWFKLRYRKTKTLGGAIICCGKQKAKKFENKLQLTKLKYYKTDEQSTFRYTFCNKEFALFLKNFGEYADAKVLAKEVYFLPKSLALSFLDGYFDGDGCRKNDIISFCTVSKELAYGIKYLVNKYYKVACSITVTKNHNNSIEGRIVNTKNLYIGNFCIKRKKQSHYFVEGDYIISPYKTVEKINETKIVYNLSVEEDESYTANGMVVHNCTFWSIAQKNNRETTAEGLGWELFKNYLIAKEKFKPDFFLYENNKSAAQAIKDQIKKELKVWDGSLLMEDTGARYIEINSALVSAQNRQRFYVHNCGEVEQPEDRGIILRDILKTGTPLNITKNKKSQTIKAQYQNTSTVNICCYKSTYGATGVAEPIRVGALPRPNGELSTSQAMRIYSINGKSVTQSASGGGMGGKTGLYAVPSTKDKNVYEVKDGFITIKDKQYPIKLPDGFYIIRKLTVTECERLQTLPDGYTQKDPSVSASQAYKGIGNGWTAEVIIHILSNALKNVPKDEEIIVLSMYDGIGTGRYCLDKMGFTNVKYFAYEIDKYAKQIAMSNYPDIVQMGDAFQLRNLDWALKI